MSHVSFSILGFHSVCSVEVCIHSSHISFQTYLYHPVFSFIIHEMLWACVHTACILPVLSLYFLTALLLSYSVHDVFQTYGKPSFNHDTCPWSHDLSHCTRWYCLHNVLLSHQESSWNMLLSYERVWICYWTLKGQTPFYSFQSDT